MVFPNGNADDRFSIAYFCHPVDDTPLVAIPSDLVTSEGACNAALNTNEGSITAAGHLESRLYVDMDAFVPFLLRTARSKVKHLKRSKYLNSRDMC